jgi:hypothetical protein
VSVKKVSQTTRQLFDCDTSCTYYCIITQLRREKVKMRANNSILSFIGVISGTEQQNRTENKTGPGACPKILFYDVFLLSTVTYCTSTEMMESINQPSKSIKKATRAGLH